MAGSYQNKSVPIYPRFDKDIQEGSILLFSASHTPCVSRSKVFSRPRINCTKLNPSVPFSHEGNNEYLGSFRIGGGGIDGVSNTDGIDVSNVPLGRTFPKGVFVAQDSSNDKGNQNYKLVPWERIAKSFKPALAVETGWSLRDVGK